MKNYQWTNKGDQLIISGRKSEDIAEKLGIKVSQVYGRKSYLARKGKGFSSLISSKEESAGKKAAKTRKLNKEKTSLTIQEVRPLELPKKKGDLNFIVNNVNISISGNVKDVLVSTEKISINY